MGLGDMSCTKNALPSKQRFFETTNNLPSGGSVGCGTDYAGVDTNYGTPLCPDMFAVEVYGFAIGQGTHQPGNLQRAIEHFAYIHDYTAKKQICESTFIEVAGYSYLEAPPLDSFWRLDGVTKRQGFWDNGCQFKYVDGYGAIWTKGIKPSDKGTDPGSVEIGAAAATAYISVFRTVAMAYVKNMFGIKKLNLWAGIHPECPEAH